MCRGGGGGSNTAGAAPRAEMGAGKCVNAKAPQGLLDSVIARQAPYGAQCAAEGGEGCSSSRGGAAEGNPDVRLVTGSTHRGGGVVQVCSERAHRDGGGSGVQRRGDGRGEPGEGGEGRWGRGWGGSVGEDVAGSGGGVRRGERANTVESACKAGQEARWDAVGLVKGCNVEDTTSNGRGGGQRGGKEGLGGMEGGA